jgi:hypothetical protein
MPMFPKNINIEKFGSMTLDKFALLWYYKYPRPERISPARWAAMARQFEKLMKNEKM